MSKIYPELFGQDNARGAHPQNTKEKSEIRIDNQLVRLGEREREQKSLKTVYWGAQGSF